jgi:hypothetical protein
MIGQKKLPNEKITKAHPFVSRRGSSLIAIMRSSVPGPNGDFHVGEKSRISRIHHHVCNVDGCAVSAFFRSAAHYNTPQNACFFLFYKEESYQDKSYEEAVAYRSYNA